MVLSKVDEAISALADTKKFTVSWIQTSYHELTIEACSRDELEEDISQIIEHFSVQQHFVDGEYQDIEISELEGFNVDISYQMLLDFKGDRDE